MGDFHYTFSVAGQAGVLTAFRSIESAAQSHQRQIQRTSSGQQQASRREAKAIDQTAKLAERAARQQEREQKRAAAQFVRETNIAHRQAAREAGIVTRQAERAKRDEARKTERAAAQASRAAAKRTRDELRVGEKAIRDKAKTERWAEAQRHKNWKREQHLNEQNARRASRRWEGRERFVGQALTRGAGAVVRGTKLAALAALGIGGAALRGAFETDDIARQIAVSGRGVGQTADPEGIRRQLQATAIATPGITAAEAGGGLQQFVSKTGRLDIGQAMLGDFATVASATGAKMDEVASAAAAMFSKFDVSSIDDMRQAFATLTFQGKQGSFELKDAASQYDRLTSAAGKLGIGKGAGAVATLGGLTQIARGGTGSAEQAATSIEAMFRQLTSKSGELKGAGVDIFEQSGARKGQARSIQDVLIETVAKLGGTDLEAKKVKLQEIFGDEGGRGVISELTKTYGDAVAKGIDPIKAMREQMTRATTTTARWNEVQRDASTMQRGASATLAGVWERLKASVGDRLIPILSSWGEKIAAWAEGGGLDQFAALLEGAAGALGWFVGAINDAAVALGIIDKPDATSPQKRIEQYSRKLEGMGLSAGEKDKLQLYRNRTPDAAIADMREYGWEGSAADETRMREALRLQDELGKAQDAATMGVRATPLTQASFMQQLEALTGGNVGNIVGNADLFTRTRMAGVVGPYDATREGADASDIEEFIRKSPGAAVDLSRSQSDPVRQLLMQYGDQLAGGGTADKGGEAFAGAVGEAGDALRQAGYDTAEAISAAGAGLNRADIGVGG